MARHDIGVFRAHQGETFVLRGPGGASHDLELVAVADLGRRRTPEGELSNYALSFLERSSVALPQATYRLEHAALGPMDVFLVPSGRDAAGVRYEAVFN